MQATEYARIKEATSDRNGITDVHVTTALT